MKECVMKINEEMIRIKSNGVLYSKLDECNGDILISAAADYIFKAAKERNYLITNLKQIEDIIQENSWDVPELLEYRAFLRNKGKIND